MHIQNYNDFIQTLLSSGFSMGGGNNEGIYSIISWNWNEGAPYETPVRWHTGDRETDPWEWRIRVLDERNDIAYGKFFFNKSGYITKEWIPYFLSARRGDNDFAGAYERGTISQTAKRIYDCLVTQEVLPVHLLKVQAGFGQADKSFFDKALTELQMKLFITMCGRAQKISKKGEEYGWSSTVFTTTELFWGDEVFEEATRINKSESYERISEQILRLNPEATEKKIKKFILS